jgi:RHS repeat-associated protein
VVANNGSTSMLHKSGQSVPFPGSTTRYYPFGGYRGPAPSQAITDRDFTGQRENMELGLLYYNARYYLPGIARFISADTLVPNPTNPQSYNRYTYVRNSPLNFTDPTGHRECESDLACDGVGSQTTPTSSLVSFSGNFSQSEQSNIISAAQAVGGALARSYNQEQRLMMKMGDIGSYKPITGTEAFHMAYGGAIKFTKSDDVCSSCGAVTHWNGSEIYVNSKYELGTKAAVHELGHAFAYKVAAIYDPESFAVAGNLYVANQLATAIPNGRRVPGSFENYGFAESVNAPNRNWHQADPTQVGSVDEEFADMFLGWTYGQWETDSNGGLSSLGQQRANFMSTNVSTWFSALSANQ